MVSSHAPKLLTIQDGTQDSYGELMIGVANIWEASGRVMLSFGNDNLTKRVTEHEKITFQNYAIEVVSIIESTHGSITLKVVPMVGIEPTWRNSVRF